jgi:uncharacterized protein DUF499
MAEVSHWADVLRLRSELLDRSGQLADLQMSLFDAVYRTRDVPYQEAAYYGEITEPTPSLIGFMADVARRLATESGATALYHLDQGMGGGKSHALVGLYHMVRSPKDFFDTELGRAVLAEAEARANGAVQLKEAKPIVLSADNMTPGRSSPEFGPATTLHERFLWALFDGDRERYAAHAAGGSDKAAVRRALEYVERPVLILLDELMDYALRLSDAAHVETMPGEQAFLTSLFDAVDEVPRVALVVVMIRSDLDERGYTDKAEAIRDYVAARLERNGRTVAVTEAQDFSAIIRRRLFERPEGSLPIREIAERWRQVAAGPWEENVFEKLPSDRSLSRFADRLEASYPFHPDLMSLVRDDWSRHAGFQRVRSTVEIFASTAYHWSQERAVRRWSPELIGVGDIPLHVAIEHVLSSGLLHGNDRAIQGFRQVAATDIISKGTRQGRAVELDRKFTDGRAQMSAQPSPCVRMASALFLYSLVARAQARRGATKAELLSAVFVRDESFGYSDADEVFSTLVSEDEGLGALEVIRGSGGSAPTRYQLTTTQTVRMFYRQARGMVEAAERDDFVWTRVRELATRGPFDSVLCIEAPKDSTSGLAETFGEIDQQMQNRLVVLDFRRWSLLNGRDETSRDEVTALLGLGPQGLRVDNASSCVVACTHTQRRETVRRRATEVLAYQRARAMLDPESDLVAEVDELIREARARLDAEIKRAYQHFGYLIRTPEGIGLEWQRFEEETKTALSGNHVWDGLEDAHRATRPGGLSGEYLRTIVDLGQRNFTLKEVVRKFWQDPGLPLVSSVNEVRRAIFEALGGEEGWEIVNSEGDVLTISSPDTLAISSVDQTVRVAERREAEEEPVSDAEAAEDQAAQPDEAVIYKEHVIELPPRSLASPETRRKMWHLFSYLSDLLDPTSDVDLQLMDGKLKLTAREGSLRDLEGKASEAEARWEEREEEF